MSKTILADVNGFTPVIDTVVAETSLMTAVVFGRIWRFCQMEDSVCSASLETIAEDIGVDKATVMRHAKVLVDAGYLKDITPDLRNHPHTYADTGKAGLRIEVSGIAQDNVERTGVAENNASVAQCNASVAESQLKRVFKKDSKILNNKINLAKISKLYENEIGVLTPMIADALRDADCNYPVGWVEEAIRAAARRNARNWSYVEAILKRWKSDGKNAPFQPASNHKQTFLEKLREA